MTTHKLLLTFALIGALSASADSIGADRVAARLDNPHSGNEELPRVLYIIPWQDPQTPAVLRRAFQSELDAMYEPLDREPFLRELGYRESLRARE